MFQSLKFWKLASAAKSSQNSQEAYSAVLELGRMGGPKAIALLLATLERLDGVARSAARELGRLGDERAVKPLIDLLARPEVNQSAAEALEKLGDKAVGPLLTVLKSDPALVRQLAARALGAIGDKRAVDPLITLLQSDGDYSVRTAAATALGQLKDQRAIWSLVATLKLRDELEPELQVALEELRNATRIAMRKIGDPLKMIPGAASTPVATADENPGDEDAAASLHPRLTGELSLLAESELISVLKELVQASEEISWANLERREPVLPAHLRTYDQRRLTAETVGEELRRRGGTTLLRKVLEMDLGNYASIQNWWGELVT